MYTQRKAASCSLKSPQGLASKRTEAQADGPLKRCWRLLGYFLLASYTQQSMSDEGLGCYPRLGCTGVTQQSRLSAAQPTAWPVPGFCLPQAADGRGWGTPTVSVWKGQAGDQRKKGLGREVSRLGFWGDLVSPGNQGDSMQGFSQSNSAFCCLCITSSLKMKDNKRASVMEKNAGTPLRPLLALRF